MGKVHVSYELIAGGTSLVEKESGERMPAMLTVYYLDGDRLLLTHYCMAGERKPRPAFAPPWTARAPSPSAAFLMAQALACEPGEGATIHGFAEDS
jgi:hypothetical protein